MGFHMNAKELLAERVASLLQATGETWSNQAIADAASKAGMQIGRSSVDRIRKAEGNPTLENIEALAAFFRCEPWHLLAPASPTIDPISVSKAIEIVANALTTIPTEKRRALLEVLASYASNPQAEGTSLEYLQAELSKKSSGISGPDLSTTPTAQRLLNAHTIVESKDLRPHKTTK